MVDKRGATLCRISTTTIDLEVGDNIVDFLKIDVQGAERQVLEGAKLGLFSNRIRLLYLEWSGDSEVERILDQANYVIFDSVYIGAGNSDAQKKFESREFEVIGTVSLSTGQVGFEMAYRGSQSDIGKVLRELNRDGNWIQTDLIAMPFSDKSEYLDFLGVS